MCIGCSVYITYNRYAYYLLSTILVYEDNINDTNQHNNTESRKKLYTAYKNIAIGTLEEKIEQIENADINIR